MKQKSLGLNAVLNGIKQCCSIIFPLITFPYISRAIENGRMARYIEEYVSEALSSVLSDFHNGIDVFAIKK